MAVTLRPFLVCRRVSSMGVAGFRADDALFVPHGRVAQAQVVIS